MGLLQRLPQLLEGLGEGGGRVHVECGRSSAPRGEGRRRREDEAERSRFIEPGWPFPIMTSVDLMTAYTTSPTRSRRRSAELAGDHGRELLVADGQANFGHEPLDREADDPAGELVPGTEIQTRGGRAGAPRAASRSWSNSHRRPTRRPGSLPCTARAWTRFTFRWRNEAASSGAQHIHIFSYSTWNAASSNPTLLHFPVPDHACLGWCAP